MEVVHDGLLALGVLSACGVITVFLGCTWVLLMLIGWVRVRGGRE